MLLCMLGACTLDGPAVPTPDRPALDTVLDSEVADSGSAPDTGCVDSDPEGTVRSLRVRTEESPSWVAWAELEVVGVDGPLTALATLDGSSPGGLEALRDGDPATNWNAGDFAPQWVRLDFDLPVTLSRVLLTVAQSPSGATEHVLETAGPCDDFKPLHRFSGHTSGGQLLSWKAPVEGACDPLELDLVLKKTSAPCWDCEFWFDPMDVPEQRPRLEVRWTLDGVPTTSMFQDGPLGVDGALTSTFIMGADALLGPGSCPSGDQSCRANFLHKLRTQVWDGVHYYNGLVYTDLSPIPCDAQIEHARLWLWIHEQRGLANSDQSSTATFYEGVRRWDIETVHGLRYAVGPDGADRLWTTPGGDIGEAVLDIEAERDLWARGFHKASPAAWFDFTAHLSAQQAER